MPLQATFTNFLEAASWTNRNWTARATIQLTIQQKSPYTSFSPLVHSYYFDIMTWKLSI
jgi:hypothetical protein